MAETLLYRYFPAEELWLLQIMAEINTQSKLYVQYMCMWFWGGAWLEIIENIKWIWKYLYQNHIIPFCPLFQKKTQLWIKPSTVEQERTGEKGNPLDEILVLLLQEKKQMMEAPEDFHSHPKKETKHAGNGHVIQRFLVSGFSLYRLVCTHWELARRDYWRPSRTQPKSWFALAQMQGDIKKQISLSCPA